MRVTIKICITLCISYLLLCIKLPPLPHKRWHLNTTKSGQHLISSTAYSLTSQLKVSACLQRTQGPGWGRSPVWLTDVPAGSTQFYMGCWLLASHPPHKVSS